MQSILSFLEAQGLTLVDVIYFLVSFVFSIIFFRKTGDIKYIKGVLSMNEEKKVAKEAEQEFVQSFSPLVPVYRLNKATNELEKTEDVVDVRELINSYKETALESMFDRFMPKLVDETADFTHVSGDLDMLTESFAVAEVYREKLGLADTLSVSQVFEKMNEYKEQLAKKIKEKEIIDNAKKIEPKEEQETI